MREDELQKKAGGVVTAEQTAEIMKKKKKKKKKGEEEEEEEGKASKMTAAGIVSNGKGDNATLKKKKKKKKKKNPQHMVAEVDSRNGVEKGTNKKQAAAAQSSEIDDIFGAPKSSKAKAKPAVGTSDLFLTLSELVLSTACKHSLSNACTFPATFLIYIRSAYYRSRDNFP